MSNYLSYKNKVEELKEVADTVKAEEKIAASYLRPLKDKFSGLQDHLHQLTEILSRLYIHCPYNSKLIEKRHFPKLAVIVGGEKMLVGSLWHQLVDFFLKRRNKYDKVVVIGSKMKELLEEESVVVNDSFSQPSFAEEEEFFGPLVVSQIRDISENILHYFKTTDIGAVDIVYPSFTYISSQKPKIVSFLPFDEKKIKKASESSSPVGLPIFEPSGKEVFDWFLNKYIKDYLGGLILESRISELSARFISMEQAKEKSSELVEDMRHKYHRERKKIITQRQSSRFSAHKQTIS